jgi:hypothetical protein
MMETCYQVKTFYASMSVLGRQQSAKPGEEPQSVAPPDPDGAG